MKAFAPNGSQIIGTFENITARAEIVADTFTKLPDGTLEFEYAGGTEVFWDDQRTIQKDGEDIYLAEDGTEWKQSELTLRDEEEDEDDEATA